MFQEITGELVVTTANGAAPRVRIDSAGANVWAGGNSTDGDLALFSNNSDNSSPTAPDSRSGYAALTRPTHCQSTHPARVLLRRLG